jgi:hypothetical protein
MGADAQTVTAWLTEELACPLHNHVAVHYRRPCLLWLITPRLSPGVAASRWLTGRCRATSRPLVTAEEAAYKYGVTPEDIVMAARTGFLGGLLRPDGMWMFTDVRLRMPRQKLLDWLAQQ